MHASAASHRPRRRRAALAALLSASQLVPGARAQSANNAGTVYLSPSFSASSAGTLSIVLSPSYAGMGVEPSNLIAFTGDLGGPNPLSFQLLSNLGSYTGIPPHLRIGGNSGDNMLYYSNATSPQINNPNPTGQGYYSQTDSFIIGPDYFRCLDQFPPNTPITYGLNLAYNGPGALDFMTAQAEAGLSLMKNVSIVGFEIGNEPDLYVTNGYRNSSYSVYDFGGEWSQAAQAVYDNVLKKRKLPTNFFEPATTATTATSSGQAYKISNLVNTGVAVDNGVYVAGWNQHDYYYYVGVSKFDLPVSRLLNLPITASQFQVWSAQAQQAIVTGKPYYLREMGSIGPTGIQGISDTFANTIWTINFLLYAATQQVSSVQMHMTQNSYGAPWQPIPFGGMGPHVRSSYYAFAAVAQIIGAQCNTRVGQLSTSSGPGNYYNNLASYSVYRGDNLAAIVMINSMESPASDTNKNTVTAQMSLPNLAGQTVYLSYLTAAGSDSAFNTTWNGISYEQDSIGTPVNIGDGLQSTTTVGSDGTLSFDVRDSQVVVASFGEKIGSNNTVDARNCKSVAATTSEGGDVSPDSTGNPAPTFKATSGFASDGTLSTGAIIGIAVGGAAAVFLVGLLAFVIVCCRRRRRQRRRRLAAYAQQNGSPNSTDESLPQGGDRRRNAAVVAAAAATRDQRQQRVARHSVPSSRPTPTGRPQMAQRPQSAMPFAAAAAPMNNDSQTTLYRPPAHPYGPRNSGHGRTDSNESATAFLSGQRHADDDDPRTWTPPPRSRYSHVRNDSGAATPTTMGTWRNDSPLPEGKRLSYDDPRQSRDG